MNSILKAAGLCSLMALSVALRAGDHSCWVYFGTSATDARRGIYLSKLDEDTGALSPAVRAADKSDSVFFAFSPDKHYLYALAEVPGAGARPQEAIETYEVDPSSGALRNVAERLPGATEACHISVDPQGRFVFTANYDGHYVEVLPIAPDHSVGERSCLVRFSGSGPNPDRQQMAHPHSINIDPSGRFAIVADLGQDKVFVFRIDPSTGALTPNEPPFVRVASGAGPRHFAFHPDGRHAFIIDELDATITAFKWDKAAGILSPYLAVPILRHDYHGPTNTAAEVVVSKDGRFVYGSNRGDDSLVVHRFDPATGGLTFVQRITDGVKVPRNYAIDPSGKWLVCGNLTANTVTVYRIDPETGRLALSSTIEVPETLCVRFLQAN
jgi:6-phosphogluconolactonase